MDQISKLERLSFTFLFLFSRVRKSHFLSAAEGPIKIVSFNISDLSLKTKRVIFPEEGDKYQPARRRIPEDLNL
jgi:hypothetical protein